MSSRVPTVPDGACPVASSDRRARPLLGSGALAGIGYLVGGVVTAFTSFSAAAATVLLAPLAGVAFLLVGCAWLWRTR